MGIDIESVVIHFSNETMRNLLGKDVLALVRYIDPRLVESNALRKLLLGIDGGLSLIRNDEGWKEIVDVLTQSDADALCLALELQGDNSFDLLESNVFSQMNEVQKWRVLNFFNVEPEAEIVIPEFASISNVNPDYSLFLHQRGPAGKVLEQLATEPRRCILHLPTGGGKTRTSMVVICRWLISNPGKSVVWLASSQELLEQAASEFEKAWRHLGDRDLRVCRVWGDAPFPAGSMADTFVVAGLAKLVSIKSRDPFSLTPLLSAISLLVFDEAHQALARTYRDLVDYLIGENNDVALLGLTATPGRTPENDVEDRELAEFFNTNRVTIEIPGYKNAIDYLIAEKYLAHANYIDIKFQAEQATVFAGDDGDEFSRDFLQDLGANVARNGELIRAASALSARHKRILLFAPSVSSAHQVSLVLRALGIDAYSLDGTTSELSRTTMIDKFRGNSAGVQILCNFGVLTTGFDAPRTSCVIIGRPTRSVVLYSQMVGRAIRGSKVGGNDQADIVTVVDTSIQGFGSVVDGFNFWNNKWWD